MYNLLAISQMTNSRNKLGTIFLILSLEPTLIRTGTWRAPGWCALRLLTRGNDLATPDQNEHSVVPGTGQLSANVG